MPAHERDSTLDRDRYFNNQKCVLMIWLELIILNQRGDPKRQANNSNKSSIKLLFLPDSIREKKRNFVNFSMNISCVCSQQKSLTLCCFSNCKLLHFANKWRQDQLIIVRVQCFSRSLLQNHKRMHKV